MTMQEFIRHNSIRLSAERVDANPHMQDSQMDHYKCILRAGRSSLTVHFSKGFAHTGKPPTAEEVLDCLASDAASVENSPELQDWCSDLGYDPDSRKAEQIYNVIVAQAVKLKRLMGESVYKTLLWDIER